MPISASVAMIPRSRSSSKWRASVSPSGRSTSASHAASSPTRARSSARETSGSVSDGNTALATRPVISWNDSQFGCGGEPVRTSSPLPSGRGEYEETERRRISTRSPSSSRSARGINETRYE